MKKITTIIILALFVMSAFAQSERRELGEANSLRISVPFKVLLVKGTANKVEIIGLDAQYLSNVKTEINGGELSIYTKGKIKSKNEVVLSLTYKHFDRIKVGGAAELKSLDLIRQKELEIIGSGAIEADLNIEVTNLSIVFSGASDLKLRGLADSLYLKTSGASDVKASNFVSKNIYVDVSGASDVKVNAIESIQGEATGASSVNVKGSPAIKAINKTRL